MLDPRLAAPRKPSWWAWRARSLFVAVNHRHRHRIQQQQSPIVSSRIHRAWWPDLEAMTWLCFRFLKLRHACPRPSFPLHIPGFGLADRRSCITLDPDAAVAQRLS
jgi:hypothetical protein